MLLSLLRCCNEFRVQLTMKILGLVLPKYMRILHTNCLHFNHNIIIEMTDKSYLIFWPWSKQIKTSKLTKAIWLTILASYLLIFLLYFLIWNKFSYFGSMSQYVNLYLCVWLVFFLRWYACIYMVFKEIMIKAF